MLHRKWNSTPWILLDSPRAIIYSLGEGGGGILNILTTPKAPCLPPKPVNITGVAPTKHHWSNSPFQSEPKSTMWKITILLTRSLLCWATCWLFNGIVSNLFHPPDINFDILISTQCLAKYHAEYHFSTKQEMAYLNRLAIYDGICWYIDWTKYVYASWHVQKCYVDRTTISNHIICFMVFVVWYYWQFGEKLYIYL